MYINSFCSIVPAGVITEKDSSHTLKPVAGQRGYCREPDYKDLIPAMQLRRMSKPVRIGVAAAKLCLNAIKDGAIPDSIHVGTAYGMLQDSEVFLQKIIEQQEQMLPPTAFIQSTHNTVAGQIALSLSCYAHNMTFVHKSHSFESAMLDASLLLHDHPGYSMLIGGVDECTDSSFNIFERFPGCMDTSVVGEGASFFQITAEPTLHSLARIVLFEMFQAQNGEEALEQLNLFLKNNHLEISTTDLVLQGYDNAKALDCFTENEKVNFKLYSGSFPTVTAFALALAVLKIKEQMARRCWIINQSDTHWSIWLVQK